MSDASPPLTLTVSGERYYAHRRPLKPVCKRRQHVDALIAQRVYGMRAFVDPVGAHQYPYADDNVSQWCPRYCSRDSQALAVLDTLGRNGWQWEIGGGFGREYRVALTCSPYPGYAWMHLVNHRSLAMAICIVALQSLDYWPLDVRRKDGGT